MALPPSFEKSGFRTIEQARTRVKLKNGKFLKPLMIGTEGLTNSGKSEFYMSAPGPGMAVCIDRGIDGCLDNPNPPESRNPDWGFAVVPVPPATSGTQQDYVKYFTDIRQKLYDGASNPECVSLAIDCHGDFWELHKLASFGRLQGIMPLRYTQPYAEHRAILAKLWDSGKIVIGTNKLKDAYEDVLDDKGQPLKEADGSTKRKKSGDYDRQGFGDEDYLWAIQIRHLYKEGKIIEKGPRAGQMSGQQWGIRILKCKVRPELRGHELWADQCSFKGLVNLAYPNIPDEEWGL